MITGSWWNLYEALTKAYESMGDIEAAYKALSMGHRILQDARSRNLSREATALQQLNYNWKSREQELQNEISDALVKGKEAAERASHSNRCS